MTFQYQIPLRYQYQSTSTPTQPQPSAPLVYKKTPFSQLDVQTRSVIENIQNAINEEAECSERLSQLTQAKIDDNRADIDLLFERMITLDNQIRAFNANSNNVKSTVDNSLKHVEAALRTVQRQYHYTQGVTEFPDPYFWELLLEFETRMKEYRSTISEIDKHISSSTSQQYTPKMLKEIIQNQYNFFVSLAAQVAKLNDQVDDMKDNYLLYRRKYFDDMSNPFEQAKKKEGSHLFTPRRFMAQPQPQPVPTSGTGFSSGFNPGSVMSTPGGYSYTSSQSSGFTPFTLGGSAAGGGYSFGATSTPSSGFTFGSQNSAAGGGFTSFGPISTPSSGFTFGSSSSAVTGGFTFGSSSGAAAGGLTFGSSSGAAAGGFTFGSSSGAAAGGFGSTGTGGFSFGSSTPSGFTFGSNPSPGFSYTPTVFSFGK